MYKRHTMAYTRNMKVLSWSREKNQLLRRQRSISFEEVEQAIAEGKAIEILEHPNKLTYPNQKILVVLIRNYVYLVPFVEDETSYFLKTIIPSRKATKKFKKNPIIER